ncbi:hypothetical protein GC087_04395 [Pantoea sp. JZ2]|uniref:hypothetical protein n=1 Tax=Pantoea sp. JZ2 TaxID=2654189 RepID=UPI002B4709ED|nr:hypothetical protein [Pantoea sp. JZ2]WRH11912.1 hypothetical protein GC087_04395 [Pantoea sp. JZ2]
MMNNGKDIEALKRAILKSKVNALLKRRETPHMHKGGEYHLLTGEMFYRYLLLSNVCGFYAN